MYYGSRVMRQNVHSSAVFTGGGRLCIQILPGHGRPPSAILGVTKIDTGLSNRKDRVPSF